jgi:hypothetical protein
VTAGGKLGPSRPERAHALAVLADRLRLLVLSFLTTNSVVMVLCWLVALVLFGLWLAAMYSARVTSQERDVSMMIDPAELRRLREQAEARKAAASQDTPD